MVHADFLGPWGRIILIATGVGLVALTALIIACFFIPWCLLYKCRHKGRKGGGIRDVEEHKEPPNEGVKLNDVSYRSWRLGSLYDNGTISENNESHRDSFGSRNAQLENVLETSSTVDLIQIGKQKRGVVEKKAEEFPTELTMSLQYLPPCDATITGKLVIGIEGLSGLPPKQYNCTLEPYVTINIIKESWSHRKYQKLHSFRTRAIRHTANPIFRETFVIADVKPHQVKDWALDIAAYDQDRYANHTELCNLKVRLKDVKRIFFNPELHLFNYRMKPSKVEFGEILLGISFLPTAQRLTINVMKVRDLKIGGLIKRLDAFYPYVKITMLNGKTGRKLKKRKTKFLRDPPVSGSSHLDFHETLAFDLKMDQLDSTQFLIVLCNKTAIDDNVPTESHGFGVEHHSDSEDSINSCRKPLQDVFIGKVALGNGVRGASERLHWFSVLQNPRKLVTVWHTLK